MEQIAQLLQSKIKNNKLKSLFLLWLTLSITIHKSAPHPWLSDMLKTRTVEELALAILQLTVLCLTLCFSLYILKKDTDQSLKLKFGILWDKDKNPHCKECRKPLGIHFTYSRVADETRYQCDVTTCKTMNYIAIDGKPKTFKEIKPLL